MNEANRTNVRPMKKKTGWKELLFAFLIVVATIVILQNLLFPSLKPSKSAEKQEAYQYLSDIHKAQKRLHDSTGHYAVSFSEIEFDPNSIPGNIFTYDIISRSETGWTARASRIRKNGDRGRAYTIQIDQSGAYTLNE